MNNSGESSLPRTRVPAAGKPVVHLRQARRALEATGTLSDTVRQTRQTDGELTEPE